MKRLLLLSAAFLFISTVQAQKYMTRTGRISFFSATPMENIEAINNEASAIVDAGSGDVIFQAPMRSFKFEKELMQEHFNENYMESDKYPKAEFKGKIADVGKVNFAKDGAYPVMATGKLTMHGVTRDVSVPGTLTVKGATVMINTKFNVRSADYGIKIPGIVQGKIAKEIAVTINTVMQRR